MFHIYTEILFYIEFVTFLNKCYDFAIKIIYNPNCKSKITKEECHAIESCRND